MKKNQTLILTFLILLSVIAFVRSILYVSLDTNFFNLGQNLGLNETTGENFLSSIAVARLLLASYILHIRSFKNDGLTYVLFYFIFTALLRFYDHYLIITNTNPQTRQYIDKFRDVNSGLIFLASLYIVYFIFFH
jgi:hypothetical protein